MIATAKFLKRTLISNEGRQTFIPKNIKNCRIPAVCAMKDVSVHSVNIAEYIRQSKKVF
jgi:predicted metal-binding transcription factor (methanogenesis marker protein 9)